MVLRRLLLIGLFAAFASSASCAPQGRDAPGKTQKLAIATVSGDVHFNVEFADTDDKRRYGLMYRTELANDGGMLFDFSDDDKIQSMWMKNTLIPLDMAFIAKDGRIVNIAVMTTPRSLAPIRSAAPVAAVLEVKGGRLEELGVKAGDIVDHPLFGAH